MHVYGHGHPVPRKFQTTFVNLPDNFLVYENRILINEEFEGETI